MASEQLVVQPQSKMWIEGSSTIRSFQCAVPEFTLTVNADGTGAVAAVLGGQKAVRSVELAVPAAKMDCGNGTMNDHMRKAVKTEETPTVRFTLASYDVAKAGDGVAGTLRGTLALGGATLALPPAGESRRAVPSSARGDRLLAPDSRDGHARVR